jgi:hypothetical protein
MNLIEIEDLGHTIRNAIFVNFYGISIFSLSVGVID